MDIIKRRKFFLGKLSPNEISELVQSESEMPEYYGDEESLEKEKVEGRRIETDYRGENRTYWVPADATWGNAKGIRVDRAYRIFKEDDLKMQVKIVQEPSEIEAVKRGYIEVIRNHLRKRGVL